MTPVAADRPDAVEQQVRLNFRTVIRHGLWVMAAVSAVHAGLLALAASHLWLLHLGVVASVVPLLWMTRRASPIPLFLAGVLLQAVLLTALYGWHAFRFGNGTGFQLYLFAAMPFVFVAGRIGVRGKLAIALFFAVGLLLGDRIEVPDAFVGFPGWYEGTVRAVNLAAAMTTVSILVASYFNIVTRQQAQLGKLMRHDALTGLLNRRGLAELAAAVAVAAPGDRSLPSAVILGDIDCFKSINDRHGHAVGDAVLQHVGALLRKQARATDLCCRWGGEEFLLLLPRTGRAQALQLAEAIRTRLAADPLVDAQRALPVTMTLGVATWSPGEPLHSVVRRADRRLYLGKLNGRDRIVAEGGSDEDGPAPWPLAGGASRTGPVVEQSSAG